MGLAEKNQGGEEMRGEALGDGMGRAGRSCNDDMDDRCMIHGICIESESLVRKTFISFLY